MNKLSPLNFEKIWKAVQAGLVPAQAALYCDVLWTLMHRSALLYARLYADVALRLARLLVSPHKMCFKAAWDARWAAWVGEASSAYWNVDDAARALAASAPSAAEDDNEWIVWKKSRLRLAQACTYLCCNGVFAQPTDALVLPLAEACDGCLAAGEAAFLDYYLDLVSHTAEALRDAKRPLPAGMQARWQQWNASAGGLAPLVRFKIMHLVETYPALS
jgi:hypothetical protein